MTFGYTYAQAFVGGPSGQARLGGLARKLGLWRRAQDADRTYAAAQHGSQAQ